MKCQKWQLESSHLVMFLFLNRIRLVRNTKHKSCQNLSFKLTFLNYSFCNDAIAENNDRNGEFGKRSTTRHLCRSGRNKPTVLPRQNGGAEKLAVWRRNLLARAVSSWWISHEAPLRAVLNQNISSQYRQLGKDMFGHFKIALESCAANSDCFAIHTIVTKFPKFRRPLVKWCGASLEDQWGQSVGYG